MVAFVLEKDFHVTFPVFALPENSRFLLEQAKFKFADFTTIKVAAGQALALFTHGDLAAQFLATDWPTESVAIAKLIDREALITALESAKLGGSTQVIFDAPERSVVQKARCFGIDSVMESVRRSSEVLV